MLFSLWDISLFYIFYIQILENHFVQDIIFFLFCFLMNFPLDNSISKIRNYPQITSKSRHCPSLGCLHPSFFSCDSSSCYSLCRRVFSVVFFFSLPITPSCSPFFNFNNVAFTGAFIFHTRVSLAPQQPPRKPQIPLTKFLCWKLANSEGP